MHLLKVRQHGVAPLLGLDSKVVPLENAVVKSIARPKRRRETILEIVS